MGLVLGTFSMKKSSHRQKISWFIHPFGDVANWVPGGAPTFIFSGMRTLGHMISGGIAWPAADPHTSTVWVLPLSPDVIPQTIFFLFLAKTLHRLLCTFVNPVSSALYSSVGLDKRFNLKKIFYNFFICIFGPHIG